MRCTQSWPEIRHLDGARLRPECRGMRQLAQIVRSETDPRAHETALLLPEDPNVEAWFDRERPALSSAIIFTDQYWDRYVAGDFKTLQARPPKVIVIGPRNYWRTFSRQWHRGLGAERLILLVTEKLIPAAYELRLQQPISFGYTNDFMDVYVRRDQN